MNLSFYSFNLYFHTLDFLFHPSNVSVNVILDSFHLTLDVSQVEGVDLGLNLSFLLELAPFSPVQLPFSFTIRLSSLLVLLSSFSSWLVASRNFHPLLWNKAYTGKSRSHF
ncbi:hypothetical protein AVEN_56549-1 [Araneus ventricosus]|uniref:Uncharacterized protein n=1 Tax=Araneus ventricosus TaxID=182803 RepID=A0A4Y2HGY4_ARAVE|nr:hypothetical protein AVEN_56549-1 [Araneus ventricosus]